VLSLRFLEPHLRSKVRPRLLRLVCRVLALCVFGVLLASTGHGQSAEPPERRAPSQIDAREYAEQLDRYSALISNSAKNPADLARLRKSIPAEWQVRAGQSQIIVGSEWLTNAIAQLETDSKDADARRRSITRELAVMRTAAVELDETSGPPDEEVRGRLDGIFKRREFAGLRGPSELQLLEARIGRWITNQLLRLLSHLHISSRSGNLLGWMVIGIAFLTLSYWVWKRLAGYARAPEAENAKELADATSRQWLEEALAAAERGEFREAIHCGYWAAVTRLEDSGILARDRARTPRESLRQLDARPSEHKALGELTRHFELTWYGYRPASAADWHGARPELEHMGCLKPSTAATADS